MDAHHCCSDMYLLTTLLLASMCYPSRFRINGAHVAFDHVLAAA